MNTYCIRGLDDTIELVDDLTIPLREKFQRFHDVYERTHERLISEGVTGALLATKVWDDSLKEMPLTPAELRLYKQLIAMHSVNGGDLFGDD